MRAASVKSPEPFPLEKMRLPRFGEKILIAVSGGLDSMVLLYVLKSKSVAHRWQLAVVHFNHHLRGRASDADEALVRNTAASMKLPFITGGALVEEVAKKQKLSIEMAARKLRHEFFAQTVRKYRMNAVALAHHADDQVELFFLRLLRGTGGSGLAGMKWRSLSPVDENISLIRPLLDFSRTELEFYARENKIRYREDATNNSPDFLRNRIRHELLPLLHRKYQPGLNKTILRFMEISGAESAFIDEMARQWIRGQKRGPGGLHKDFEKLSVAMQRQVLRVQITRYGLSADFDLIESLRQKPGLSIAVNSTLSVSRDERGRVRRHECRITKFDDREMAMKLEGPGKIVFDEVKLKWRFRKRRTLAGPARSIVKSKSELGTEMFDADKTNAHILLRHWRAGDRFQPIGLKSPIKLQDLFTNAKIPREQRHKAIVAETGGQIFWVEGLRISENFKITPQTRRFLVWSCRRLH